MVAIRIDLRCISCDNEEMMMAETAEGEELVVCSFCQNSAKMADLQEKVARDAEAFKQEGIKAVMINKSKWFF